MTVRCHETFGVLVDCLVVGADDGPMCSGTRDGRPGRLPDHYMPDIDTVRHDRAGQGTRRWTRHGAWATVLERDDREWGNTDNSIEELTVASQFCTA